MIFTSIQGSRFAHLTEKKSGCKFYLASDAHHPDMLERSPQKFEEAITMPGLTENYKFEPFK